MNKYKCTGFVFCPSKTNLKGNEYHTICYDKSSIVYVWDIVEGRDHPISVGRPQLDTSTNMKTVGIVF